MAIAITAWQVTTGATAALRRSTYDHLTAVRETKRRLIENYFTDLRGHVLALSSDESGIAALEAFRAAWTTLPSIDAASDPRLRALDEHYREVIAPPALPPATPQQIVGDWSLTDGRARALQVHFIADNPHPQGTRDLLLEAEALGPYGAAHAKYHPTLQRYQSVFGFYDVFLIDARDGRILYTVFKEVDLGRRLTVEPLASTGLARAYRRALQVTDTSTAVLEDYAPYVPSRAPAAFAAAPIWRAGEKVGVLAIQVSIDRINAVMTSDRNWAGEGLGRTGHTQVVAADGTLRSDLRWLVEQPELLNDAAVPGIPAEVANRIRQNRTAILNLALPERVTAELRSPSSETAIGTDLRGAEVIRSHARLNIPGLDWYLVAEMQTAEAFAPATRLLRRLMIVGGVVTLAFLAAAWVLARSVTRPVLALVSGTRALASRDFKVRLPLEGNDEFGQLAGAFNDMAERLDETTVSRDELDAANQQLKLHQIELQALNQRLIDAQEEERRRLARELHDDLSQRLAGAAIAIGTLGKGAGAADGANDVAALQARLREVHAHIAQIAKDVHGLSHRLHPAILDDLGLVAAVESECRRFFELGGPPVDFAHRGPLDDLDPDIRLAVYRIIQEALRNILTHAAATEVRLHLEATDREVRLEVADNGRGFNRQAPGWRGGLGLASMVERARLLAGTVTTTSEVGQGTMLVARIPREVTK